MTILHETIEKYFMQLKSPPLLHDMTEQSPDPPDPEVEGDEPSPSPASAPPCDCEVVTVVREPPLQVRRHWPLEHEELTEEHEPEQSSSPPHETRHRPLLQEVDRPYYGDNK